MHIIYLSGGSFRNKAWIETVKSSFDVFSGGQIMNYDNWQTGDKNLDFAAESKKLANIVKDMEDYCVFAKSIGSVLALKSIHEKIINPKKMIVCGHPYILAKELNFPEDEFLRTLTTPTIFIQNEFDPLFSYTELEKILKEDSPLNYRLIKNSGNDTHDYEDYKTLAETAKSFFQQL